MSRPPDEGGGKGARVPSKDRRLWWALAVIAIAAVGLGLLASGGGDSGPVPSVVGLGEEAASNALVERDFATQIERERSPEPPGTVIGQEPAAGAELESGQVVRLTVSGDPAAGGEEGEQPAGPVAMPDLVGRQQVPAGEEIERLGLVPDTRMVERGQRCCVIVGQRPGPGTEVEAGETVELDVALAVGADRIEVPVPNLDGLAAPTARARARELGFTMQSVEEEASAADLVGKVIAQRPRPGASVPEFTRITLTIGI